MLRRLPSRLLLLLGALLLVGVAIALLSVFGRSGGQSAPSFIPPAHAEELIPAPPPAAEGHAPAPAPLTLLPVDRWLASGEFAWRAEETAPGPVTIVVDLRARTLSVYRQGVEIGRSSVVYGFDEKPTPTGVFPILEKDADHVSSLYGAPMPWMLRLTWDGVAIHGSPMADDKATHGCIGVPDEFGEKLFALARKGGRVIVHNGPPARADYSAYAALPYGAAL
ncbi:MAG TPA: L,D-transpeptidase family protein [Allosphingosinicella sp.]|jgi:lipoprotein-anchoring transpeptidase ErfK/SrfK